MEERKQFTFYLSFFHAISRIRNKAARCDAYDAICAYALTGAVPDLDTLPDAAAIAFELSRPNLDSSIRKAKNGKAGGSAKQTGSKREANAKQEHPESEKEKEKEKEIEIENECYIPPIPPTGDSAAEKHTTAFDAFWAAYPKKVGKGDARRAFAKVKADLGTLLSAIAAQKGSAQWAREGGRYIPNPATWLNQGRWEDELNGPEGSAEGVSFAELARQMEDEEI